MKLMPSFVLQMWTLTCRPSDGSVGAAVSLHWLSCDDQSVIGQHEERICPRDPIVQGSLQRPEIGRRKVSDRMKRNVAENVQR